MNIKQLGDNVTLLATNHGDEVLFHKTHPIAGFNPLLGYYKNTIQEGDAKYVEGFLKNAASILTLTTEQIGQMFL